jgi:hypothetical protein
MNKRNESSNGKIGESRPRFDHKQAEENAVRIQTALEGLETDNGTGLTKGFRERLKEVSELFKTLKPLHHEDRDKLWSRLDVLYKEDRKRGEKRHEEQEANASKIRWEIGEIKSTFSFYSFIEPGWKKLWEQVGKVSGMFKGVNLSRTEREELWGEFNSIVSQAKEQQNSRKSDRENMSKIYKDQIFSAIGMTFIDELGLLCEPDDLKYFGKHISEGSALLSEHKKEMTHEHKQECFQHINEARENLDMRWKHLKESYGQRSEAYHQQKEERGRKHDEFVTRVRANIEKNREKYEKATNALSRSQAHLEDLQEKLSDARSDDFTERVSGWITEEENRIESIKESLERLEKWIEEDEEKLR